MRPLRRIAVVMPRVVAWMLALALLGAPPRSLLAETAPPETRTYAAPVERTFQVAESVLRKLGWSTSTSATAGLAGSSPTPGASTWGERLGGVRDPARRRAAHQLDVHRAYVVAECSNAAERP